MDDLFLLLVNLQFCRVSFEFQHNVCGRSIYAEGAIDAVIFLANKVGILSRFLIIVSNKVLL